jgi:hypothetical protein
VPAIQTYIFNICIGQDMTALKMAIVNEEIDVNQGHLCNNATDCSYFMLSCRYLRNIKDNIIQVDSFLLRFIVDCMAEILFVF